MTVDHRYFNRHEQTISDAEFLDWAHAAGFMPPWTRGYEPIEDEDDYPVERCQLCRRIMTREFNPDDPDSLDCGGDCWKCIEEAENM